jgi:hypothetical protein
MEVGPECPRDHLIELLAIPPAVHIAFAHGKHPFGNDTRVNFVVMDLNVPGAIAIDAYIGCRKQAFDLAPIPLRSHVLTPNPVESL